MPWDGHTYGERPFESMMKWDLFLQPWGDVVVGYAESAVGYDGSFLQDKGEHPRVCSAVDVLAQLAECHRTTGACYGRM